MRFDPAFEEWLWRPAEMEGMLFGDFIEAFGLDWPRRDWLPFGSVWGDEAIHQEGEA